MYRVHPIVEGGYLYQLATGARPIVIGSPVWYDWLEHHYSFVFIDPIGEFIARKSGTAAGNQHWKAFHKRLGKLYQMRLGSSHMLTLERLQDAAQVFAGQSASATSNQISAADSAACLRPAPETVAQLGAPRSLMRTKLYRPSVSGDLILRDRLIDRLNTGLSGNVTLLCTPAGFGKSTLLAQWLQAHKRPAAWLSLDENDEELAIFVSGFTAALRTVFPDACPATASLATAQRFPSVEQVATLLLNELADLPADVILVLDDYHLIHNSEVHTLLALLIEHLPPSLHLVLASRTDPPLPFARWRARGLLHDLRGADLRFTLAETHAFLERIVGQTRASATAEALEERTEGWIALLRLAALSLRSASDPAAFLDRLASNIDSSISSYLVEEILAQQAPAVQDFLVRTSMLKQLNAQLCAATLESDAPYDQLQAILTWLEHANLFLIPLDDRQGWYRYHPLFKQLLEQRLREYSSPAALAQQHHRASAWYSSQGLIEEAIEHALMVGDVAYVIKLVEAQLLPSFEQERVEQMERWLSLLSDEHIQGSPILLLAKVWILQTHRQITDFPRMLTVAEQLLATRDTSADDRDVRQSAILHALIAVWRSQFQFFYAGQSQVGVESARSALRWLPPGEHYIASFALMYLAFSLQGTGQEDAAFLELNQAMAELSTNNNSTARLLFALSFIYLTAGKLDQAEQAARHLLLIAQQADLILSQNLAHWLLGVVAYEWNHLDAAIFHFSAVIVNQHIAHSWVVREALFGLAFAYQAQGSDTQANETARGLLEWMQGQHNMRDLMMAYAFRGQLALLQDEVQAAEQWLEMAGEQEVRGPMRYLEDPPITAAWMLLARGDEASVATGQALLTQLLQHVETMHSARKTIQVLALQAWSHDLQGQVTEALAVLERAFALAGPGGFIRTFADLPQLARVLHELRKRRKAQQAVDKSLEAYLQRILAAMKPGPSPAISEELLMQQEGLEPLTDRERQILRLLDEDLTNKEIAQVLVVTPGTVKVHTNSIYRKLSVNNRRAATRLARALGILPSDQASTHPVA